MSKTTHVYRNGQFLLVDTKARCSEGSKGPYIIQDSMDPLWHPCTGEIIDSKSRFREVTKVNGGEEMGNESFESIKKASHVGKQIDFGNRREDIQRSIEEIKSGNRRD